MNSITTITVLNMLTLIKKLMGPQPRDVQVGSLFALEACNANIQISGYEEDEGKENEYWWNIHDRNP